MKKALGAMALFIFLTHTLPSRRALRFPSRTRARAAHRYLPLMSLLSVCLPGRFLAALRPQSLLQPAGLQPLKLGAVEESRRAAMRPSQSQAMTLPVHFAPLSVRKSVSATITEGWSVRKQKATQFRQHCFDLPA